MCFKSLLQVTEVLPILYVDAILFYPSIQKRLKIERRSRLSDSVNRACVHCEGGSRPRQSTGSEWPGAFSGEALEGFSICTARRVVWPVQASLTPGG